MEQLIKMIVTQEERCRAASFYISILIAYLEDAKWYEAEETISILESMMLLIEEQYAVKYLSILLSERNTDKIKSLTAYLYES